MFGGLTKIGKSWLAAEMIRSLMTQECLFGQSTLGIPRKARVLQCDAELGEKSLRKRLLTSLSGIDPELYADNFYYVSKVPEMQLDKRAGLDLLRRFIDDSGANVVFLDPIGRFHGAEENDRTEIAKLLVSLDSIKAEYPGLAMVMTHHFGKPAREGYDPLDKYNFRGSSVWMDYADTLIMVRRVEIPGRTNAWSMQLRYTMRHGEEIPDTTVEFNRNNDCRVRVVAVDGQPQVLPARALGGARAGFQRTR